MESPITRYWKEITAIVEAGLKPDPNRVSAFTDHLAGRLEELGEDRLATRLRKLTTDAARPSGSTFAVQRLPSDVEAQQALVEEFVPNKTALYPILPCAAAHEIERFVELNKRAGELYSRDIEPPTSLLLFGPPGCGKTMAAAAIAADLGLPLLSVRLDSLIGAYLGNSAKNLRRIFDGALSRPSVLLLDEFDAIGKMRDDVHEIGEIKRLVVGLLQNLDRVRGRQIVIAATNHDHILDSAVWRRFDVVLPIMHPGRDELRGMIERILDQSLPKIAVDALATLAVGLSGAGIADAIKRAHQDSILDPTEPMIRHLTKAILAGHQKTSIGYLFSTQNKKDLILAIHAKAQAQLTIRQVARLAGCSAPYVHEILQAVEK